MQTKLLKLLSDPTSAAILLAASFSLASPQVTVRMTKRVRMCTVIKQRLDPSKQLSFRHLSISVGSCYLQ